MGDNGVATTPDVNSQYWNPAKYAFSYSKAGEMCIRDRIIGEAGGSVHGRFIGGIVVECIVVYHQLRLKAFVILSGRTGNAGHVYPSQPLEYAAVYGAVHQSACRIAYACIEQGTCLPMSIW